MALTTLDSSASAAEAIAIIERDGGVIIKDYLDAQALAELRTDLTPALDKIGWGRDDFSGAKTRRLGGVFKHSRHAITVADQPHLVAAAKHFFEVPSKMWFGEAENELTSGYQLGVTQVIEIHPGEGAQPLHRDDSVWQWKHVEGGRQARLQVMVAVTDFTAENGGTLVIPGSHKWYDPNRAPKMEEAIPTEMEAGSALIFIGGVYHAGGTNNTDKPRMGFTLTYDLSWLRQEENHYLTYPLKFVKTLPEHIQGLLGYRAAPPLLGWVEIDGVMCDPSQLLSDEGDIRAAGAVIAVKTDPAVTSARPSHV